MKRSSAFTLLELICTLVIMALVLVAVGQSIKAGLQWVQEDAQRKMLKDQFEYALRFMEEEVRCADDVLVKEMRYSNLPDNWSKQYQSDKLRLRLINEKGEAIEVAYFMKELGKDDQDVIPPERPKVQYGLSRKVYIDGAKSQPLALGLNNNGSGLQNRPHGFIVTFFDRENKPCSIMADIYSIEVSLSGETKQGETVTCSKRMPLAAKMEKVRTL